MASWNPVTTSRMRGWTSMAVIEVRILFTRGTLASAVQTVCLCACCVRRPHIKAACMFHCCRTRKFASLRLRGIVIAADRWGHPRLCATGPGAWQGGLVQPCGVPLAAAWQQAALRRSERSRGHSARDGVRAVVAEHGLSGRQREEQARGEGFELTTKKWGTVRAPGTVRFGRRGRRVRMPHLDMPAAVAQLKAALQRVTDLAAATTQVKADSADRATPSCIAR